jgi:hypothetical protein
MMNMKFLKELIFSAYLFMFTLYGYSQTSKIIIVKNNESKLTEKEKTNSKILKVLNSGDRLELLEVFFPNGIGSSPRFRVLSEGLEGFITSYFIQSDPELEDLINNKKLFLEAERDRLQDSLKEVKNKQNLEYLESQIINEEEEIRKNDSIADIMIKNAKIEGQASMNKIRQESEIELKTRKEKYIPKYGQINGEKVAKGVIWIGMNEGMLLDSWGQPEDINQTVTKYLKRKQYVYANSQYVYVDDGIVTAYQN